ncbi:neuropilin-1-like [Asterias amurensis]|uniref:neuropilin-1-like n=1 Tax=Asterias amurensis TaxID=7602 RepID=UPI003AB68270
MAVLSGLIFLLLEMCLEVSASYSVSGLYRGVPPGRAPRPTRPVLHEYLEHLCRQMFSSVSQSSWMFLFQLRSHQSTSYSVSGLYRGVWYQPVEHHALLGQSFMNISGISAVRCSVRCLSHHGCFSFNYDNINQLCQMNNAIGEQTCDNFQGMQYVSYYDATAEPRTCQLALQNSHVSDNGKCTSSNASFEKLGLEDGSISDESLSASSNYNGRRKSTAAGGRLNKLPPDDNTIGAWHAEVEDTNPWIQVDLGNPTYVTGVLIQGRNGGNAQWVTKYKVQFEPPSPAGLVDVNDQLGQTQIFNGNTDGDSIVERRFFKPVLAVKIRIVPVEWYGAIALRFELLASGCK